MMPQRSSSIPTLRFAYLSAVALILVWLTAGQGIIQLTLSQEVGTRTLATSMHYQELRSQRLLRNAILLLPPGNHSQPLTEMQHDAPLWETAQKDYESHPERFTSDQRKRLVAVQGDYTKMDGALHALFAIEGWVWSDEKAREHAVAARISIIFYSEIPYLREVDAVFTDINAQADSRVTQVQVTEILLYILAILTLLVEYRFVIHPVLYPPAVQEEPTREDI